MPQRNLGYLAVTALLILVFLWHAWAEALNGDYLTACGDMVMAALCTILFNEEYHDPTSIR